MFKVNAIELRNFELNHSVQLPLNIVFVQTRDGAVHRLVKPGFKHTFTVNLTLLTREGADDLVEELNTNPNNMTVILPNGDTYTCNYIGEQINLPDHTSIWELDLTFEGTKNG